MHPVGIATKLTYGIYGTLYLLLGTKMVIIGAVAIGVEYLGLPQSIWKMLSEALSNSEYANLDHKTAELYIMWFGVGVVTIGSIPITLGVLAWLRYLWAMIVGTALWLFLVHDGLMASFAEMPNHKFELALTAVLLTLIARSCFAVGPQPYLAKLDFQAGQARRHRLAPRVSFAHFATEVMRRRTVSIGTAPAVGYVVSCRVLPKSLCFSAQQLESSPSPSIESEFRTGRGRVGVASTVHPCAGSQHTGRRSPYC